MDNLTHSLVGALIGQAGLKRKTGLAMPALVIGANLPDVDAACFFWLEGTEHLGFRRGITHGPPAMVLLPLVLAGLLYGFDRWQAKRGKRPEGRLPVSFKWLYLLSLIGCLSHPALDWLNTYGIRLLEPFSSEWFCGDILFIIDIWLWLGLGFATWFSLRREKQGGAWRRPARIAIAGALAYIGLNGLISQREANDGAFYAQMKGFTPGQAKVIAAPSAISSWEREVLFGDDGRWYRYVRIGPDDGYFESISSATCRMPDTSTLRRTNSELDAFLFWSRAPFVTPMENGEGIQFNDARFYDPVARGRFSVEVPGVECEELPVTNDGS